MASLYTPPSPLRSTAPFYPIVPDFTIDFSLDALKRCFERKVQLIPNFSIEVCGKTQGTGERKDLHNKSRITKKKEYFFLLNVLIKKHFPHTNYELDAAFGWDRSGDRSLN
jgi:hypothetical protein